MRRLRDFHRILQEEYPDVYEMWVEAVNADFESEALFQEGKFEEANMAAKFHVEKWEEYQLASKLIFCGDEYETPDKN